jgi:glucosamine--fructose-6-phosphate aminotransferase (isomerizing)
MAANGRRAGEVMGQFMAAEIADQPAVLARLIARAPEDIEAVSRVVPRPLLGVFFLARGSSDNAAVLGRYISELVAGRPAGLAAPSLYTRYRAVVDWHGFLVVALSQSGATPEIVTTCRALRCGGAVVVAVTNTLDSELAAAADVVLSTDAGLERALPATKTVTAEMLLMVTVARALGSIGSTADELIGLPSTIQRVVRDATPMETLAHRWAQVNRLVITGRGFGYAAALECALKIKETTGVLAEGISAADLRHGPIAVINAGVPALLVNAGGPVAGDLEELRKVLLSRGADVVEMPLPTGVKELLGVITAVVRGQQLALAWALQRGLDPDAPPTLTKVTRTE